MQLDKVTEAIAHFIGLFHLSAEQARLRKDYDEFQALQPAEDPDPELENGNVSFRSPYTFNDPDPHLHYVPGAPDIVGLRVGSHVTNAPPEVPVGPPDVVGPFAFPFPKATVSGNAGQSVELSPPGSVAVVIRQENHLSDRDYVGVGGHGLAFMPVASAGAGLDELVQNAVQQFPMPLAGMPGTADAIGSFVAEAAVSLAAVAEQLRSDSSTSNNSGGTFENDSFVAGGRSLEGIYVNGELLEEAPKFEDHLPVASPLVKNVEETDDTTDGSVNGKLGGTGSSASGQFAPGSGSTLPGASVKIDAGENVLVNTVTLANNALVGKVVAAAGDHMELNAVVQVNAWSDSDAVGQSIKDWVSQSAAPTITFNIADFHRVDPAADTASVAETGGFPQAWVVTEISGDLIFMNWVQQFNFVIDDDVHVVASSGVTTAVTTGENQTFNDISINELGYYYDLILVGGSIYDANIIAQMNVMLDDDTVGGVNGFHTSGQGSASTGSSLLWNEAKITNIGEADRFEALPGHYKNTLDDFSSGKQEIADGILGDDAFMGLAGLRVLYVSGSIYDLQYVSQTNVLGDADQVATVMHTAAGGAGADWTVTTGSNALVNAASILDVDSTGKTYVGGEQYSDEILVQTDIIRTDRMAEGRDADALVSEAVAFLGDDQIGPDHGDQISGVKDYDGNHAAHSDIMQSVVS